uniref:Sugar transporter SWEET1 n=1 Tax=Peronospora matthiolae TaxID=2874970 RepID=A0AAV1UYA4_9STRA
MEALLVTFQVLTIITSVCMRFAPYPDFYRIYKAKSTGEVQILPVVLFFTNCVVLVWYGYLSENILPLVVTAVVGILTCGGFIAVFYCYTDDKRSVYKTCAVAMVFIVLLCLYGAMGVEGVTGQSKSSMATAMGAISIGTSIGLYGSPLATIRRILRTKSTASMPFTFCVVSFCNSVSWVTYAIILGDVWILLPNAFGCILTLIQLILYVIYPPSWATAGRSNQALSIDHRHSTLEEGGKLSLSVSNIKCAREGVGRDRKSIEEKSVDFVELRSPRMQ